MIRLDVLFSTFSSALIDDAENTDGNPVSSSLIYLICLVRIKNVFLSKAVAMDSAYPLGYYYRQRYPISRKLEESNTISIIMQDLKNGQD